MHNVTVFTDPHAEQIAKEIGSFASSVQLLLLWHLLHRNIFSPHSCLAITEGATSSAHARAGP